MSDAILFHQALADIENIGAESNSTDPVAIQMFRIANHALETDGDRPYRDDARAELASLRAEVTALQQAVNEARAERDECRNRIESYQVAAKKFSSQHYYGAECDPQVDPQDWYEFDRVFGLAAHPAPEQVTT